MKLKRSRKKLNFGKPSKQSAVKEWGTGTLHFPRGETITLFEVFIKRQTTSGLLLKRV